MSAASGGRRTFVAILVGLALGGLSTPAAAAKTKKQAKGHYKQGKALIAAGDHEGGLEKLLVGHGLYPTPKMIKLIASTYETLGQEAEAYTFVESVAEAKKPKKGAKWARKWLAKRPPPAEHTAPSPDDDEGSEGPAASAQDAREEGAGVRDPKGQASVEASGVEGGEVAAGGLVTDPPDPQGGQASPTGDSVSGQELSQAATRGESRPDEGSSGVEPDGGKAAMTDDRTPGDDGSRGARRVAPAAQDDPDMPSALAATSRRPLGYAAWIAAGVGILGATAALSLHGYGVSQTLEANDCAASQDVPGGFCSEARHQEILGRSDRAHSVALLGWGVAGVAGAVGVMLFRPSGEIRVTPSLAGLVIGGTMP